MYWRKKIYKKRECTKDIYMYKRCTKEHIEHNAKDAKMYSRTTNNHIQKDATRCTFNWIYVQYHTKVTIQYNRYGIKIYVQQHEQQNIQHGYAKDVQKIRYTTKSHRTTKMYEKDCTKIDHMYQKWHQVYQRSGRCTMQQQRRCTMPAFIQPSNAANAKIRTTTAQRVPAKCSTCKRSTKELCPFFDFQLTGK